MGRRYDYAADNTEIDRTVYNGNQKDIWYTFAQDNFVRFLCQGGFQAGFRHRYYDIA